MVNLAGVTQSAKQIAAEFSEKNVTFMAAGIAYNAFISLAPMLIILLLVISAIGGGLEDRIIELSQRMLPGPIADVVTEVFGGESDGSGESGATAVGLIVLIWGTLKIFRGLDTAFSEIYETVDTNSFVDKLVDGFVVFVSVLVAILATVGVTAVFAVFSDVIPFVGYLTPIVLVVGLILAFFPIYYRFPDADVGWRDVLPGTVFAAVGWAVFQAIFQVYLAFTGGGPESFFGGVIVVVTWLYFSGLVLLLGAVINAVLGCHASGEAGGVGRGATGFDTERQEKLTLEEFATYLAALREELTGRDRDGPATVGARESERYPGRDAVVEVTEQTNREEDADEREWAVAFRWRTPAEEPAEEGE